MRKLKITNDKNLVEANKFYENNVQLKKNKDIYLEYYQYYKNYIRLFIINNIQFFYTVILFILSNYLYFLSLEKCIEGFDECSFKVKWILIKLIQLIISSIILSILIHLMIFKIVSKFHLIHLGIFYVLIYEYSHGLDFSDHGFFNIIGLICITFFLILLCFSIFSDYIIFNKK